MKTVKIYNRQETASAHTYCTQCETMLADPRRPYEANRPLSTADEILRYHYGTQLAYCPRCSESELWSLKSEILFQIEHEIYALDLDRLQIEESTSHADRTREIEWKCYNVQNAYGINSLPMKIGDYIDAELEEFPIGLSESETMELLRLHLLSEPQPIEIPSSRIEAFCKAQREQNARGEALAQENLKYIIENTGSNP